MNVERRVWSALSLRHLFQKTPCSGSIWLSDRKVVPKNKHESRCRSFPTSCYQKHFLGPFPLHHEKSCLISFRCRVSRFQRALLCRRGWRILAAGVSCLLPMLVRRIIGFRFRPTPFSRLKNTPQSQ